MMNNDKVNIGIIGASGVAGSNILDLLLSKNYIGELTLFSNSLIGKYAKNHIDKYNGNLKFSKFDINYINKNNCKIDFLFLAVPHGKAKKIIEKITNKNIKIIDLSVDYRCKWTYGLPELHKNNIKKSLKVANPGCYATACILSVAPLIKKYGILINHIIFDCISGYSGGGKNAKDKYDANENIIVYQLTNHFHLNEIKNEIKKCLINNNIDYDYLKNNKISNKNDDDKNKIKVSFTPHVVPVYSGIMCSAHIIFKDNIKLNTKKLKDEYLKFYKNTKTSIKNNIPCTKDVMNTPECYIGGFELDDNGQLIIISVIDNLMKGAASQAIENLELML